ncbi:MAG: hypothetical protein H0V30_14160 [Chitinophagaceae bacterium]|jgi:hypothetical protein|nr:hypothetical protein [Chitinophagaceae bacterium]
MIFNFLLKRIMIPVFIVFISASLFSCGSTRTISVEEGWEILGESKVNFVRDRDEIDVRSTNDYTALRFMVEKKDVRVNYLRVVYVNGDVLEPLIDDIIGAGQQSKIIELSREGQRIDRVEFKYRSTGNILKGRATVLLVGRRFDRYRY